MPKRFLNEFYEELMAVPSETIFLFMVGKSLGKKYALNCGKGVGLNAIEKFVDERKLGKLNLEKGGPDGKEFVFRLKGSAFKTKLGKNSCHVISGALAGFVEQRHGKYAGAQEIKCVSAGHPYCQFHVKVVER